MPEYQNYDGVLIRQLIHYSIQLIHQKARTPKYIQAFSINHAPSYSKPSNSILSASARVNIANSLFFLWYFICVQYILS